MVASVITGCPSPSPKFTGVSAHKRHIYSYHRVQNSYQLYCKSCFDSNVYLLFLHVPLSTLAHIIGKGSTFSISSPFDITNYKELPGSLLDGQLSILNVNGHAYSYPLRSLWRW
jgi:hypothetical protein